MSDIFIGRQPIYDRAGNRQAYELLYRTSDTNSCSIVDGDAATAEVILHTLTTIGLESLLGPLPGFLNVTRDFILKDRLTALPRERIVLEVLEHVVVDEALLQALQRLAGEGFRIALDDFVWNPGTASLLPLAEIVKLDILATPLDELRQQVAKLRDAGVPKLLAEKIETEEQLNYCAELGFDLYQGYYFCQPSLVRGKAVPTNHAGVLLLLCKLNDPDATVDSIESLITRDVALTYRLLRHINSAWFGLSNRVESIRRALLLVGLRDIRVLATLMSLASLKGQRNDLSAIALLRATMCESLAEILEFPDPASAFTVGLLSIVDVMTSTPMGEVVASLPLTEQINDALAEQRGPLGRVLAGTLAYERGDWHVVEELLDIDPTVLKDVYIAALRETRRLLPDGGVNIHEEAVSPVAS